MRLAVESAKERYFLLVELVFIPSHATAFL